MDRKIPVFLFIYLLLQHIPPKHFRMVGRFGLYSRKKNEEAKKIINLWNFIRTHQIQMLFNQKKKKKSYRQRMMETFDKDRRQAIDPFCNTDAGYGFPSGDAFLVYPGKNGPIESLRIEVFYEALQDLRALKLLEGLVGKEKVVEILDEDLDRPITFNEYPCDSQWLLLKREQINRKIAEANSIISDESS